MRGSLLVISLMFVSSLSFGQEVVEPPILPKVILPAVIESPPGDWIIIAPLEVVGGPVKWRVSAGLQEVRLDLLFPPEIVSKSKGRVFKAKKGKYTVEAWNAKDDIASDIAVCTILVGDPEPDPTPGPGPTPGPVVGAYRVLILEESASKIGIGLLPELRSYLDQKTLKVNNKPQWRKFDQHVTLQQLPPEWQQLRSKATVKSVPWVTVGDSLGNVVHDGPYVSDDEALKLFKKLSGE